MRRRHRRRSCRSAVCGATHAVVLWCPSGDARGESVFSRGFLFSKEPVLARGGGLAAMPGGSAAAWANSLTPRLPTVLNCFLFSYFSFGDNVSDALVVLPAVGLVVRRADRGGAGGGREARWADAAARGLRGILHPPIIHNCVPERSRAVVACTSARPLYLFPHPHTLSAPATLRQECPPNSSIQRAEDGLAC